MGEKTMRKIKLSLGLLLICLLSLTLISCFGYGDVYKTKSSGYFRYQVDKETNEVRRANDRGRIDEKQI